LGLRTAIDDVELAGVIIPAGTLVIVNSAAANRDPAVYDEPDRLDIAREGAPATLTFGGGMHYCLGANLARLELAEALAVMTRRMPNARRTGPAPWKPLTALSGPATYPSSSTPSTESRPSPRRTNSASNNHRRTAKRVGIRTAATKLRMLARLLAALPAGSLLLGLIPATAATAAATALAAAGALAASTGGSRRVRNRRGPGLAHPFLAQTLVLFVVLNA